MGYHSIPYDRRIRENIKNYSFSHLYDMDTVREYLQSLADVLEINILLTARHGEKEIVIGDSFLGFYPDVVMIPGGRSGYRTVRSDIFILKKSCLQKTVDRFLIW